MFGDGAHGLAVDAAAQEDGVQCFAVDAVVGATVAIQAFVPAALPFVFPHSVSKNRDWVGFFLGPWS